MGFQIKVNKKINDESSLSLGIGIKEDKLIMEYEDNGLFDGNIQMISDLPKKKSKKNKEIELKADKVIDALPNKSKKNKEIKSE